MALYERIFKNSSVYVTANMIQKFLGFLLIPLYTRVLTPDEYGKMTVITAVSVFVQMFLISSLSGAITRFYFEYRNDSKRLKEFLGTVFLSLFIFSMLLVFFLWISGDILLKPVLGDVPFYPLMLIGLVGVLFFPVFHAFLSYLQTVEKAGVYGIISVTSFVLKAILTVILLFGTEWGAAGPLTAGAFVYFIYCGISFIMLREKITFTVKKKYLIEAFKYTAPLLFHHLLNHFKSITDKVFINKMIGSSFTGIYNIGFHFGSVVSIISIAVNRAIIPSFMHGMKTGDEKLLDEIRELSLSVVFAYCFIASILSVFSREVIMLFTTSSYYEGFIVVPFISFNFVARGIYFLTVNTLFYFRQHTKLVIIGTFSGAVINIILNYFFIKEWGFNGAAIATMASQIVTLVITAFIADKFTRVKWNYGKFATVFILNFVAVTAIITFFPVRISVLTFLLKFVLLAVLFFVSSKIMWNSSTYLVFHGHKIIEKIWRNRKDD
ncbi:MAG: oligosaccharide flippase family protein [bacterium]